ncbi:MAG: outer membrane beta-barrel protein [Bacteroidota bacterium]
MKKLTLLLCSILLLSIHYSIAQTSIGIGGGANFSNVNIKDNWAELDPKTATYFYFGITPRFELNEQFAILADLEFSAKGFKTDNVMMFIGSQPVTAKSRISYLVVSPELEYRLHKNIGVALGGFFGLKTNEEQKFGDQDWISTSEFDTIKEVDYGLEGSIRVNVSSFFIKLAYSYGLRGVGDLIVTDEIGVPMGQLRLRTRTLQLGAGYLLSL